ncbi:PREDICTED: kinesin-like protein KIF20B isoform X2 [Poecilia mexicana]|uniref:kinesin-like protein KIF20B isoform X2 n=1 Tax=Poecilia mexicana TaxID=48701 RepID=UPI00072EECEB|nr:PREDICTED: kinesin-like protein KIF20B isoform X2 [Poecilia mexicana]
MTDSCLNQTDLRRLAEDGKSKLSAEFIPSPDLPHSCVEDKEHLQVYLRIRPFTSSERSNGESQDCVAIETPDTVLLKPPSLSLLARLSSDKSLPQTGQRFQFSRVYGPETTQSELFEGTVKDLVKDVLEGENSLVFTYGVTNSGKTFTFLGPDSEAEAGILPRALRLIFSSIGDNMFQGLSVKPHRCREFLALSRQQQADEAQFKNSLLKQLRENDKSSSLQNSTNQTWFEAVCRVLEGLLSAGSTAPRPSTAAQDRIILDVKPNTKFSVWVSFCEIYNENIHDLLEVAPSGAPRRPALRLAQDGNSNAYVKDLRWVQVSSAEEAFRVVKLGRRNQSFSSTRLNQLSSRSHSIFSIRILSVEDGDPPRVHTISELCLCDLAGSERCAKTQNKGERLKEAGNINASLLILGKCIKALRYNQQAKLLQHIPFRESKLTHYLQGFFCGRGKACMIVNINQCASMYDETLNVLKFSAVAQKVVVLISRPLPAVPSCSDASSSRASGRRSAGWETSLEDVPEDEEDEEEEEEDSVMEDTTDQTTDEGEEKVVISKVMHEQVALLRQLQVQLKTERSENLLLEARVREEISREFSELFSDMQKDYDERLVREREILEERAERRLEIFKNLTRNMSSAGCSSDAVTMDRLLSCQASELPAASHFSLGSGPTEKKPEDDQNHEHRADDAEEKKWLLLQLQEKSVQVEHQLEDLQKKTELGAQNGSDRGKDEDQLQEALAELQKEQKRREELMAALEYQTLGKEEALASLQEERRAREEVQSALEESRRRQQELRVAEQVEVQTAVHLQPAVEELEEKSRKILDQSYQIHVLTEELQQLKQQLHTPAFSSSDGVEIQLREEVSELSKRLEEEKKSSETKQKLIQQLEEERKQREAAVEQQVRELQRKLEEQEELRVQLETQREASNQEAEQLQLKLRLQQEAAEKLRDDLREAELHSNTALSSAEGLDRVNSDLQREITSLREEASSEMEQTRQEKDRQLEEKLAEMERRSAEREAELQENLHQSERKVATLQEKLQEAEQREEKESLAVQEVRRKEVERRQELLAVAHEALAEKDAELEKKAGEISRLKLEAQEETQQVKSLRLELQRKEDDSSDLREKLADYRKQVQQVQKEVSAMRAEETTLKQKLSDMDKTRKQLQSDLSSRDRTIQQLRAEQQDSKAAQLYQEACKELQAKQQVMEDMRLALTEQEETQQQMEQVLDDKMRLLQELSAEVEKLKGRLLEQSGGSGRPSDDLRLARDEASRAQQSLKVLTEKQKAERRKWQEEKLSLIGQAKEAEDKRNQEMRKFAEDRERYCRQQSLLESRLEEKEAAMESWRAERDTLVAALEVQLQKLLASQADKDKLIKELQQQSPASPAGANGGRRSLRVAELQASLAEKEAEIVQLKENLQENAAEQSESSALAKKAKAEPLQPERRETRSSTSSRGSSGFPSVLESSEVSTETGRTSRFPRPELEISFSPLQPDRLALRRQGDDSAVTVKINRNGRKRKSSEMEKEEVETENRRNTRTKLTPKLSPQTEESATSQSSLRGRKDGALQKIGDFLQRSPTALGSGAKKMMSLVSGRVDAQSASSSSSSCSPLRLTAKRSRKKLYRPEISCPMEMPPHPIINQETKDGDGGQQIKLRLRSRVAKC